MPLIRRKTSLKANIIANYIGKGWDAAMGLAFVPLYINFLGPEAFGIVGFVALLQVFIGVLDLGMTPTLVRETARFDPRGNGVVVIRDLLRSIEIASLLVCVAIFLAVSMTSTFIAEQWVKSEILSNQKIAASLTIAAAVISLRFFETIYRGSLYGLQRQVLANIVSAIMSTLRAVGSVILLAVFSVDIEIFFLWQGCVSALSIIVLGICVYTIIPKANRGGRFSLAALLAVWRFALGMFAISVLSIVATQGDKVLLSRLIPLDEFGYYVFAAKIASTILIISGPVLSAIYPEIVQHVGRENHERLVQSFHQYSKTVVSLTAPIAGMFVIFSEPLVEVWSGSQNLAASVSPLLSVLVLGTFLHAQCVVPYQFQLAYGWTSLSVWANLAGVILLAFTVSYFVPIFGVIGAAWAFVGLAAGYLFVGTNLFFFRYMKKERFEFYLKDIGVPASVAFFVPFAMNSMLLIQDHSRATKAFIIILTLCVTFLLTILASVFLNKGLLGTGKEE